MACGTTTPGPQSQRVLPCWNWAVRSCARDRRLRAASAVPLLPPTPCFLPLTPIWLQYGLSFQPCPWSWGVGEWGGGKKWQAVAGFQLPIPDSVPCCLEAHALRWGVGRGGYWKKWQQHLALLLMCRAGGFSGTVLGLGSSSHGF